MNNVHNISADQLTQFAAGLLRAAGVPDDEADIVAGYLVESNLRGHDSHGVVRIPDYLKQLKRGDLRAGERLRDLCETPAALAVDASLGFGFVQMRRVINRVADKARELGVASATVMNCGHIGQLGDWVERTASEGLAGLIATNDNGVLQCVAPPGGTAPRISTNPIAIGVPTARRDDGTFTTLVLDISTAAVANGKIKVAYLAGEPCPEGWLQDHQGNPTTNPAVRFEDPRGTILPMGGAEGYKGFGLGLLFDILVGGLSGGFCPPPPDDAPGTNNVVLVLWDPERFTGSDHFLAQADKLIDYVRNCPRKPGVEQIRLPGDRSGTIKTERQQNGIPLSEGTWNALCELAATYSVPVPV